MSGTQAERRDEEKWLGLGMTGESKKEQEIKQQMDGREMHG